MAINKSYVRPHTEVYQFLDKTVASTGQHLTACIIGALYDLYRYGKEVTTGSAPAAAVDDEISVDYTFDDTNPVYQYHVDKASAQVYAENVLLSDSAFAPDSSHLAFIETDITHLGTYRILNNSSGGTELSIAPYGSVPADAPFDTRPLKVGDTLLIQKDEGKYTPLVITELVLNADKTAYTGVKLNNTPVINSDITYDEIEKVCDTYSGVFEVNSVDEDNKKFKISNSKTFPGEATSRTHEVVAGYGTLYPEFRVLLGGYRDEDIHVIGSVQEILEYLGTIDVWNELAYAAYCALKGSQGRDIYVIRVDEDSRDGYQRAMRKTDADTFPYSFVPVVDGSGEYDQDIIKDVVDYCNDKSDPEVQMWRQTIAGVDAPKEYTVTFIGQSSMNVSVKVNEVSTKIIQIVDSDDQKNYSFRHISINGGEGTLSVGDIINLNGVTDDLIVTDILADNTILVDKDVTANTYNMTMKKANTSKNHVAWLHGLANQINNRRGVLVWCDGGVYDGQYIKSAYLAAEVAGICSAVLPQQSITLTEIQSITSCSSMYLNYTQRELDNIAAGGILIITQDNKYGVPYIRHQLTTDAIHGSLYSEMSITRNLDNISYGVADVIRGYCGKANVTTTSIPHLRAALLDKLTSYTQDSVNDLIGPSLVRFYDLTIEQDKEHKDMVIVNVTYELPLPMNNIKVYQMVYAATIHMDEAA